jgi:hypothetical protein
MESQQREREKKRRERASASFYHNPHTFPRDPNCTPWCASVSVVVVTPTLAGARSCRTSRVNFNLRNAPVLRQARHQEERAFIGTEVHWSSEVGCVSAGWYQGGLAALRELSLNLGSMWRSLASSISQQLVRMAHGAWRTHGGHAAPTWPPCSAPSLCVCACACVTRSTCVGEEL